jgi:hypothetical protein
MQQINAAAPCKAGVACSKHGLCINIRSRPTALKDISFAALGDVKIAATYSWMPNLQ